MLIPDGFNTIAPYLVVDDAEPLIQFLKDAFEGVEVGRTVMDGRIANSQVKIGDSTVMIGEARGEFEASKGWYYLYVENADESMKSALEAGGELVMEVADMDYDDRQGGVKDPAGNIWWVSQRLVEGPYIFD